METTPKPRVDELDVETALMLVTLDNDLQLEPAEQPGRLQATINGQLYQMNQDALDDLEARGWVEHTEAGVVITERGRYWAKRAAKAMFGVDRLIIKEARKCQTGFGGTSSGLIGLKPRWPRRLGNPLARKSPSKPAAPPSHSRR